MAALRRKRAARSAPLLGKKQAMLLRSVIGTTSSDLAAMDELRVGVVRQRVELRGAAIGEEVARVVGLVEVDQAGVGEQRVAGVAVGVGQVLVLRQGVVERQPPDGARVPPLASAASLESGSG